MVLGVYRRISSMVLILALLAPMALLLVMGQGDPTVEIAYPGADDIVAGTIDIQGTSTGASRVEVKLDADDYWTLATGTATWNFTLDTGTLSDDEHIIFARAVNGTQISNVGSLRFHVNNTPPEFISMDVTATPLSIGPSENVTVSGFLEYDTGVKVSGVTVTISIMSAGIQGTVVTDENGYFIRKVAGPADAGTYTITVSASDGSLEETRDYTLTVTTPYQPDLTVSKIELNPPDPETDDSVEVFATVDNLGDQEATGKVNFYIDDDLLDSKAVTIDKSKIVKTVWIARTGTHTIKVEVVNVDPADKDESNNMRTMEVIPRSVPKVELVSLAPSNPTPREGAEVSVLIRLENHGYAGTTGSLELYDGPPTQNNLIGKDSFIINADGTVSVYIIWSPTQGEHTLNAKISVVGEDETEKHSISTPVSVLPPLKKKGDTPSAGVVLVLLALVATAILIRVRD